MKEYEELSGGIGPTVAYRAQRHRVREQVRDNAARLSVHGVGYPLDDLTMTGSRSCCHRITTPER